MAGSAGGQDEANPEFWLATQAGNMGLSCPTGICRFDPRKKKKKKKLQYNKSFIDHACLVKMAGYGLVLFLHFDWPNAC